MGTDDSGPGAVHSRRVRGLRRAHDRLHGLSNEVRSLRRGGYAALRGRAEPRMGARVLRAGILSACGRFGVSERREAGRPRYSVRSACIGSIEAARRAGTNPATTAQTARTVAASARMTGSWLLTP